MDILHYSAFASCWSMHVANTALIFWHVISLLCSRIFLETYSLEWVCTVPNVAHNPTELTGWYQATSWYSWHHLPIHNWLLSKYNQFVTETEAPFSPISYWWSTLSSLLLQTFFELPRQFNQTFLKSFSECQWKLDEENKLKLPPFNAAIGHR